MRIVSEPIVRFVPRRVRRWRTFYGATLMATGMWCARSAPYEAPSVHRQPGMRTFRFALTALYLAMTAVAAHAQPYPSKTIRLIVPYAPGGIVDYVGRILG